MFNSQRINNDPFPYVTYANHHRTDKRSAEWDIQSDGGVEYVRVYEPRPEYDNDPNPILLILRENIARSQAGWAFEVNRMLLWVEIAQEMAESRVFSREEEEHARKVLERLVNVYGEENK